MIALCSVVVGVVSGVGENDYDLNNMQKMYMCLLTHSIMCGIIGTD